MNRIHAFVLAAALAAAGHSFADDITVEPFPFVSTASRAQVQDELRQSRQAGANPWADDYNPITHFRGGMTRAEVTAGYLASRNAVAAFSGEDSGSMYLARAQSRTRATLLARAR
jgi:hypothetical protein